ncbi:phosphotransferase [Streptomyces mesophilus]|uniref:phosphotransferase n=1 Tax=Streptomyces mesophilus TaxID=1775132 RepID=UPI003321077D
METRRRGRAVDAVRRTVLGLGLRVDEVVVVHDSDRAALRLLPCDVLARVGPAEAGGFEFEVEVARRVTAAGAPVGELESRVDPGVHLCDGFAISLWRYYESAGTEIAPAAYADALMRHHAVLRRTELDAPHFTERVDAALREVDDVDRSPELPAAERDFLSATLGGLASAIGDDPERDQLLHGEPHPGNLLGTSRGPLFVDLATCCRGPVEFDLAHAPEAVDAYYTGADPALVRQCRALNWALFSAWRWREEDRMPDREHWRAEGLDRMRAALGR